MQTNKQNKLTFEERQLMRRNRNVYKIRFKQGIKQLFIKKINFIIFLIFIAVMTFAWFNRYIVLFFKATSFENIFRILVDVLFWLIFTLFASGILIWFGKPKKAQAIEDDLKDIFKIEDAHRVPILVSITNNNDIETYKLYSPDFARYKYEDEKANIEQKLGIKILSAIKSKGKYIFFNAISNKDIKNAKELRDDRI